MDFIVNIYCFGGFVENLKIRKISFLLFTKRCSVTIRQEFNSTPAQFCRGFTFSWQPNICP